jgi:hypothetical protein
VESKDVDRFVDPLAATVYGAPVRDESSTEEAGMRGRHIAALGMTAALAVGGATVAVGQGTGGTLGAKAQGSTTFQVRLTERSFGVHCSNTTNLRRCERQRNPRIGSLAGGSGGVFQGNTRVGTAHFTNIVTQRGRNADSLFLATAVLGDGTIALQGISPADGTASSAITGGTGAYAGARGYTTEEEVPSGNQREFRINITLTFIP